jgi:nitrogen-specific signal transduction histidine kinase
LSNLYNQTFVPLKGYLKSADLFMQMSEGIISLNSDRTVAFLNAPIEQLLDIKRETYLGKAYTELFIGTSRSFRILRLIDDAMTMGSYQTRDILISTLSGRDVYVRATASPVTGRDDESIGVVVMIRNIEEFNSLKDQLRKIDVLASLGSTISGMAHEVRTPLGYIRSLAELTAEDLPDDAPPPGVPQDDRRLDRAAELHGRGYPHICLGPDRHVESRRPDHDRP